MRMKTRVGERGWADKVKRKRKGERANLSQAEKVDIKNSSEQSVFFCNQSGRTNLDSFI